MTTYLQAEHISKSFGDIALFDDLSLSIMQGEKIALIARNGAGKTSLLNILAGEDSPDSGIVTTYNNMSLGYLSQNPVFNENLTVLEAAFSSSGKAIQAIKNYENAIQTSDKKLIQSAIEQMDAQNAWDYEAQVKQIISRLKIGDFDAKLNQLSGGQIKRLALANVLITEPDLLILDEPTNHLDLEMVEWLEVLLKKSKSTLFMVTHDRYFLDNVCTEILELDNNKIHRYRGNYSYFLEKRAERIQNETAQIAKSNSLYKKELDWMRHQPQARTTKAKYRVENFQKIKEDASRKIDEKAVQIDVKTQRLGKKVLELYNLYKSFGELKILHDFNYKFARNAKIGIVGKNGSGKTTFLNMLLGEEKLDAGTIKWGETVQLGYYRQSGMQISNDKRVLDVVRDIADVIELEKGKKMTAFQFLEHFLFSSELQYSYVSRLSGGEKRRLYLLTILMKNPNFLILDEPTNDLDIVTLNILEEYLQNFKGSMLIVSHDRYFMDKIVDSLFVFDNSGKIKNFPGNYSNYRAHLQKQEKEKQKIEKKQVQKPRPAKEKKKFSYKQKRELELLEQELENLESQKKQLSEQLNSPVGLDSQKLNEISIQLAQTLELLDEKEFRWLELTDLQENS